MSSNLLEALPKDLLATSLWPLLNGSTRFVLSKVDSFLHSLLINSPIPCNPIEEYIKEKYLDLIKWDLEGPAPSVLTPPLFELAVRGCDTKILKKLKAYNCPIDETAFDAAALRGNLKILRYLHLIGAPQGPWLVSRAAEGNNLDAVRFLVEELELSPDLASLNFAARNGNAEMINFLRQKDLQPTFQFAQNLARSGRVDLLEAALAEGADFSSQQVYLNAAEGGHVKMLQFAFDKGLALTERSVIRGALAAAIQNGDVEVLEWFAKEQKLVKVSDASLSFNFVIAIERDHLNVLEYAVRHGLALDPLFYGSAIREKNQRIIAFLEANHCPLDAYALAAAVSVKDRALLENLDEQKIPYNEFVASTAASMGDVDMLCYLIDVKRCPFGQGTLGASTVHSSLNTFLHLVEQRKVAIDDNVLEMAVNNANLLVLDYCRQKGFSLASSSKSIWKNILRDRYFNLPLLKAVAALGFAFDPEFAEDALEGRRLDLLKWLSKNKCPMNFDKLKKSISSYDHLTHPERDILAWLTEESA